MKLRHSLAFALASVVFTLASCTSTVTIAPDGTKTTTTAISGEGVAIGAVGAAGAATAITAITGDK
jgi:hypothetical protein